MIKKITIKTILFLITIISFNNIVFADTSIDVHKYVNNVRDITNTFYYDIIESNDNPETISGIDSNFEIVFDENTPISNDTAYNHYTIDFSNATFSKVGVYKFKVVERESENEKVYPKDNNTYTILVNVTYDVDDNNTPTGQLLINVSNLAIHDKSGSKSEVRFETNPMTYLSISKKVTGDMADKNEYFKFKLEINGGDGLSIVGQDETVTYEGETINTINTYDSSVDNYIYLKHGQRVIIGYNELEDKYLVTGGTSYTVYELGASQYITYINGERKDYKSIAMTAVSNTSKNEAAFVNNYESTALTGVFIRIMPFIVLLIISIVGIFLLRKNAKN